MSLHRTRVGLLLFIIVDCALLAPACLGQVQTAQAGTQTPAEASPVPQLQLAPLQLQVAPSLLPPPLPSGGGLARNVIPAAPAPQLPAAPLALAPLGSSNPSIFLRADSIEGVGQKY